MTRSTRSASTTSRSTASRAALWLVLSMITDLSANSHSDAENDDNEHNNGDGSSTPASRSTSPASGAAQNSTRSTQGPQDLPHQEGQPFSLDSNPASGTTTPTAIEDPPRPRDPRRGARTRATDVDGGQTEAVNGTELQRRKLQIEQLALEIQDAANAGLLQAPSLTPPSSIPQQTKVESGEPKATSGPGGGNISVSAIFYISWHPQFPTQIPWLVRRNNQLPTTTTDHTERREASEGWEGGVGGRGFELEIGGAS